MELDAELEEFDDDAVEVLLEESEEPEDELSLVFEEPARLLDDEESRLSLR